MPEGTGSGWQVEKPPTHMASQEGRGKGAWILS